MYIYVLISSKEKGKTYKINIKSMAREIVVSEKVKFLLALLGLQFCFAGFHIVSRVALNIGVSQVVYPVYRNIIALLLLGPFAYFLEK